MTCLFEDSLDKDTYKTLEDLGLSDFDYNSITSLSLEKLSTMFCRFLSRKPKHRWVPASPF